MIKFFKDLVKPKDSPVKSNQEFWTWFEKNASTFHKVVESGENVERDFFTHLSSRLSELREGYFYLAGMEDDQTAELVLTADGEVKNLVFVEELVASAPFIPNWKFTALKQPMNIDEFSISLNGIDFSSENLWFSENRHSNFPDEIDISIFHNDYTEEEEDSFERGFFLFLENYLGELNMATLVDNVTIGGKVDPTAELIPITKLADYLVWREKEFVEKYEGVLQNTDDFEYSVIKAEMENGNKLIASVNTELLGWEKKASHPWILVVEITFDGEQSNGMPDKAIQEKMDLWENRLLEELRDSDGYLNIGRETGNGVRELYFACKEFRKSSKVVSSFIDSSLEMEITYEMYKDKYWRSFDRYILE